METRTSHSSPCFLRVAEASAASSAPKMISLSTLFSLETASTTSRISLFMGLSTFLLSQRRQTRPVDLGEPDAHREVVHFQLDALAIRLAQHAGVTLAAITRRQQFHLHAAVHELREMRRRSQHTVAAGRRHLE